MAFTVTFAGSQPVGSRRQVWGTLTSAVGDNTLTLSHGLAAVDMCDIQLEGALNAPKPKQTHSASASPPNTTAVWDDTQGLSGRFTVIGHD